MTLRNNKAIKSLVFESNVVFAVLSFLLIQNKHQFS